MKNPPVLDPDLLSIADARSLARRARVAAREFKSFPQGRVDRITHRAAMAGFHAAERLARAAVEETGIGRVESKAVKNRFATRFLWDAIRDMPTCGIVREDPVAGIIEVADPFGVVAAIIPTTNPTSTALFKALCCLKSRNGMVASPHPRAARCIRESVRVVREAAEAEGAPADLLLCMDHVSIEGARALMTDPAVDLILATGGRDLVRAAYSSGKPAFGVGPGNVPVYVDRSADVEFAARTLVESQLFDYSVLCSSEQALVVDRPAAGGLRRALLDAGAHFTSGEETRLLEALLASDRSRRGETVGVSAERIAEMAGFGAPAGTHVLVAEAAGVGREFPLSREKLCPVLAFYTVDGHREGCRVCLEILDQGGLGHTLGLYCTDEAIIRAFALEKPVNRIILNGPTSTGAVGYTTGLFPSMTLGCGAFGGNITSDNVGPQHLINLKRLARTLDRGRGSALDAAAESGKAAPGAGAGAPAPEKAGEPPLSAGPWNPDHLRELIDDALRRLAGPGRSGGE